MKTITAIFLLIIASIALSGNSYAFTTTGFIDPYGIASDAKSGYIYVSNINGEPDVKDDNGFISRLKNDGSVDNLRIFDGTQQGVELNAPKGMVVVGNFLYVCDIDALRAFNVNNGKYVFDVNFGDLPRQNFYDITVGSDGALYVADAGENRIYRIDLSKQHEVTLFVAGDDLGNPHGLAWYTARQRFVVTGGKSGHIMSYDKTGKQIDTPAIFLKEPQGISVDDGGNLYVADKALNSVFKIAPNFALYSYAQGITGPAGVAYDRATNSLVVAVFGGNSVQSYPVSSQ